MIIWKKWLDGCLKILNDNIRFMNGKVLKKKHVGNPMSYTTTSWEKMLTTHWLRLWGWFLGNKKRENLSIHWWSFSQGFFQGGSCTATPYKNAEKCLSHVQNIAKLTVQSIWCYCDKTWLEKLLGLEKNNSDHPMAKARRPNDGKVPWLNPKRLENVHVWSVANTRVPTILTKKKQQNPVLDIMFINRFGYNMV